MIVASCVAMKPTSAGPRMGCSATHARHRVSAASSRVPVVLVPVLIVPVLMCNPPVDLCALYAQVFAHSTSREWQRRTYGGNGDRLWCGRGTAVGRGDLPRGRYRAGVLG